MLHLLSALNLQAIASSLEENERTTCFMLVHICTTAQLALYVFLERKLLDIRHECQVANHCHLSRNIMNQ